MSNSSDSSSSKLAQLVAEARRNRWCTRRFATTCAATSWCAGLQAIGTKRDLARELALLPLADWYDLPDFGGAIYHAFALLDDVNLVDEVLDSWIAFLPGHYRIADAIIFYVVREGLPSESVRVEWLRRAEEMALESGDASLIESLVYALGPNLGAHVDLLRAANRHRRGHAPLDRALTKFAEVDSRKV
jgi:hypothetical protein